MKNVVIIILFVFFFIAGYFVRSGTIKQETNISLIPSVTPVAKPTTILTEEESSLNLVKTFEEYQKQRNAIDILKLFTPSTSPQEAKEYVFLMALDLPVPDFPRLYSTAGFGYKTTEYKILKTNTPDQKKVVEVEESRSMHDNTTGQWSNIEKKVYIFELEQVGFNNMIAKYYPKEEVAGKYKGFY